MISMFAILALICFVVKLFHGSLGSLDLLVLGLVFVAAHLAFTAPLLPTWVARRR
jgi:hypothetical protein